MLARKVFASSAFLTGSRFLGRGLDILAALVMARFLSPADFGVVTIGLAALMVLESFTELPVEDALLREKELLREDVDTAFTLSALRGLGVGALLCAAAVPLAMIYDDNRLVLLICLLGIAPVARGLRSPMMVRFARDVNYKPAATIDAICRITSFVLAVACAWYTQSYLSLVLLSVTPQIIEMIATHVLAPYRPHFTLRKMRFILSFAGQVTISRVMATLSSEGDRFIVGGFVSKAALGFFSMGRSVATTASWSLAMPLLAVMYPGLAQIREEPARFRRSYLRGQGMIVFAILPLSLALAVLADPLVRLALGEEWLPVVPVMQAISLLNAAATFSMPAHSLAMATGEIRQMIWRELATLIVSIPAVTLGAIYYGLIGAVLGRVLAGLVHTGMSLQMVSRLADVRIATQLVNPWRSVVSSGVFAATLYLVVHHMPGENWLELVMQMGVAGIAAGLAYVAVHLALWKLSGLPEDSPEHFLIDLLQSGLRRFSAAPAQS
ncbi:lipopolysaccharide biosynthesis protein [Croceicoccus sp. Ery5]|uniref:lipopolysaccharide biosynthesis protein n=1 Tax=Croceicoccus sp. Ery5 TaxID=1703340 RepID=UPI001E3E6367|nr:lipopolysaccharide biosynthesis protein [Croceicoccus sp. Ery5]